MSQNPRATLRYAYGLALIAFLLSFIAGAVHLYSRGIFVKDQIRDFDVSRTAISASFSIITAAAALFSPVLGILLDRYPFRRVMAIGAAWLGLGFLLLTQVSTFLQFVVLSALFIGTGTSAIGTVAGTALVVNWFDRHRGLALAVATIGYSVAGIVMGPIGIRMLERLGWRGSYLVFAGVSLLVAVPMILLWVRNRDAPTPESPGRAPTGAALRGWKESFGLFIRDRRFWQATGVFGVMSGIFVGLNVHLFLHLTDRGLDPHTAAWVLSFEGLLAIVSKPVCGWLVDRYGSRRTVTLTVIAGVISTALLPAVHSYASALFVAGLLGFAFGSIIPLQAALISRMYRDELFARAYGAIRLTTFPISAGLPLMFGFTYDHFGGYEPGFLAAAALLALTLPTALRLQPQREPAERAGPQ